MDKTLQKNFAYILVWLCMISRLKASPVESEVPSEILLTNTGDTKVYAMYESLDANLSCKEDILKEREYIVLENGSLLLPQNNHIYPHDVYVIQNKTAFICMPVVDEKEINEKEVIDDHNFSEAFLSCGHIHLDHDEFQLMKNGTLYIDIYKKYYEPTDYYMQEDGVYVCLPNFVEMIANSSDPTITEGLTKFSMVFVYVSHVGLGISIISLFLHLLVFCCVSSVRNLPGCCLASLSISLLVAYLCFVCASFVASTEECANLGLCLYYFFLTSFFWMNAIAFDVWRSFRVVMRELRISNHRVPWRRFLLYSAYSWLIPAALTILAKIADTTDILPEDYRPSFGIRACWFGQRKSLMVFFAAPLCVVMVLNGAFFLDSAYVINRATIKTSHVDKALLTRRFFMFMRLALLMGLTWIVGIIAGYVNNQLLWHLFVVMNTLQGLFIFVVFSCSSKVRISFLLKLRGGSGKRQSVSVRTISQASGAF